MDASRGPSAIPGWFRPRDRQLFAALLDAQAHQDGVVVEIGCYLGRSAVEIGAHLGRADRFVVNDLFGADLLGTSPEDLANELERERSRGYQSLTRQQFEQNFLAFHPTLPEIVQRPSRDITEFVEPNTARFVHVDGSHLFENVREDAASAKIMLRPGGVVVFDDYRAPHTPGTAAAVWGAVALDGLVPFAVTVRKLYATWGDSAAQLQTVRDLIASTPGVVGIEEQIFGHLVLRIREPTGTPAAKHARQARPLDRVRRRSRAAVKRAYLALRHRVRNVLRQPGPGSGQ